VREEVDDDTLEESGPHKDKDDGVLLLRYLVTEPPREGVRRQDQLERFSAKREYNQHT
jgi:hypothetical protein